MTSQDVLLHFENNEELSDDTAQKPLLNKNEKNQVRGSEGLSSRNKKEPEKPDYNIRNLKKLNIRRLIQLAKPELPIIVCATFALLISSAAGLWAPISIGQAVDVLVTSGLEKLPNAVGILFVVLAIAALFTFVRYALFTIAGERVVARLRQQLFSSLIHQEIGFFDVTKTGELTNRLASDCTVIQDTVTANVSMSLRWVVGCVGGLIIIWIMSWKLTLIMFALIPLIAFGAWIYGKYVRTKSQAVQQALADAGAIAEETFGNIRTVRAFSSENSEIAAYSQQIWMSFGLAKKRAYAVAIFMGVTSLLTSAGTCAIMWYGSVLVVNKELTPGNLVSFLTYTLTIGVSFMGITSLYGDLMKAVGSTERVFSLLDRIPQVRTKGGLTLSQVKGILKLEQVTFRYPSRPDTVVLQNFNLELEPGKVIALVGPSGGGKTTVVNLIEAFYYAEKGSITLDGVDIKELDPYWLHKHIAIVSQEPTLFARTIAENIAYGCEESDFSSEENKEERIIEAAKFANAHNFIVSFKDGYRTMVGERGVQLSGGQKQRIAIARALIRNPKVLLLDEATSALDTESEWAVKEAIDKLLRTSEGRSVLVIAHRLSTVQHADEVVVIQQGTVVERGKHEQLLAKEGLYKKLVSRQLQS
jgi:ABC-type multidrug transport system fused ATPase/permease subunit